MKEKTGVIYKLTLIFIKNYDIQVINLIPKFYRNLSSQAFRFPVHDFRQNIFSIVRENITLPSFL